MNKLYLLLGLLLSALFYPLNSAPLNSQKQKEIVSSLNYLQYSTARIKMSENKAIAEEIYYSIIDQVNIEKLSGEKLNTEYTEFLANLSSLKLKQNEKDFITHLNEEQQKKAYLSAFSNLGSVFVPGQTPTQMVITIIYTTAAQAVAVANAKNQLRTQLEKDMFYLNQDMMNTIFSMQTSLFSTSASLLSKSDGLITNNTMGVFMDAIKTPNLNEKIIALSEPELQKNLSSFPPYWYELGTTYQQLKDNTNAIKAYNKFALLKKTDIIKRDKYYVKVLQNRIQILLGDSPQQVSKNALLHKNEILGYINLIKQNYLDSEAGEKNAYLAKIYYLLGNVEESKNCLNFIIGQKSRFSELLEEAVTLKILIESAQKNDKAAIYQIVHNFSLLSFGSEKVNFSLLPTIPSWDLLGMTDNIIDRDYICWYLPETLNKNYDIKVLLGHSIYLPHYFQNKTTPKKSYLSFVLFDHDDIKDNTIISLFCRAKNSGKDMVVNYRISPVSKKVYLAAKKAYSRVGSNIQTQNAETALILGHKMKDYDYEVEDENACVKDIRKEVKDEKKGSPEEVINDEVSRRLVKKLNADITVIQKNLKASVNEDSKRKEPLFSSSFVNYNGDYFIVGIHSICFPKQNTSFSIDKGGNLVSGFSLPQDNELSIKRLQSVYDYDFSSMIRLGIDFVEGNDCEKNPQEGVLLMERALKSKSQLSENEKELQVSAFKKLCECYEDGIGVPKNSERASYYQKEMEKIEESKSGILDILRDLF